MVDNEVLACLPEAIAAAERPAHKALTQELFRHRLYQALELADGYAFRFPAAALADVERFVANERKCCPFLAFEVRVAGAEKAVWLKMTGPEGTREVLQAELDFVVAEEAGS